MADNDQDQKFVEDVVKAIVDNPDDVKTERTIDERGVLIKLYVNSEDMGKIIGKEGKTAKAIRTLLRVFGAKNDARLNLKIVEPEGSERSTRDDSETDLSSNDSSSDSKKDLMSDIPSDVLA
jgi:predicted RNA-binding protein YlqC (UPF0109 family)